MQEVASKKSRMWCYFKKTHWKRWRLLGLGQVNNDNFLNLELELLVQLYIWTKTTYPVQPPTYGNTLVCGYLTPAGIYCQILPSADSFLVFCQFLFLPRKCSTANLVLHFGQLWQAASGIWRQNRDYPKDWILSTFSVKKCHYTTPLWPVCV